MAKKQSKFDKLERKIEKKEGYSKEAAAATAAKIGRAKYGAEGMAKKAAAARKRNEKKK